MAHIGEGAYGGVAANAAGEVADGTAGDHDDVSLSRKWRDNRLFSVLRSAYPSATRPHVIRGCGLDSLLQRFGYPGYPNPRLQPATSNKHDDV
jgi:hypothetical protein